MISSLLRKASTKKLIGISTCNHCHLSTKPICAKKKTKIKRQKIHNQHPVIKHLAVLRGEETQIRTITHNVLTEESKKIIHLFETNRSQVLGFNLDEFKKRIDLFRAINVSISDAITLSLSISSSLHINNSNFKKILKVLRTHGLSVEKIVLKHPFIGGLDHRQLQRNLDLMEDLNLQKDSLCDLVLSQPLLLTYPLNKASIDTLKKSSFGLDEVNTIIQNMNVSLEMPAVENENIRRFLETSKNFDTSVNMEAIEFLSSYDVDWKKVYLDCPELLIASRDTIELCIDNIVSAPFYFEIEDIEKLLMSYPDVFLSFSQESVAQMVKYLVSVSLRRNHLYRTLSQYPEIFQDPDMFFQRVELFRKAGLTDKDVGLLLAQKGATNCFIDCEDFIDSVLSELLEFYFKEDDLTIQQVVFSAPISLSVKFMLVIKERVGYLRHIDKVNDIAKMRKKKKTEVILQTVIKSNLKHFVEQICGMTLEHYYEVTDKK